MTRTLLALLVVSCIAWPAAAQQEEEAAPEPAAAPAERVSAQTGDFEIGLEGSMGRFVNAELTGFNAGVSFGYFVHDSFEVGVLATLSYLTEDTASASTGGPLLNAGLGSVQLAQLATGAGASATPNENWSGSAAVFLKFFPFALFDALPDFFAPFVGAGVGAEFVTDLDPFVIATASLGINIYVFKHVAFVPEFTYGFVYPTDDRARFGGEEMEHVIGADWGVAVFF
jgi:hypothetical protein